jgi:hypothetical protein
VRKPPLAGRDRDERLDVNHRIARERDRGRDRRRCRPYRHYLSGAENAILAALVIETLAHFRAQQPVGLQPPDLIRGANSLAAALNQRLAQIPGERVWQMGQIPRGAFDNIQRAIAEGLAGRTRH